MQALLTPVLLHDTLSEECVDTETPTESMETRTESIGLDQLRLANYRKTCELTDALLRGMSPQERDVMMQRHLAAAMGPAGRFRLVCAMTDFLLAARKAAREARDSGTVETSETSSADATPTDD